MAEIVVLHHRTPRRQLGRSHRIPLRCSMRLTSWVEKSLNWCSSDELIALQTHVQSMVDKDIKLVDIIQVMLVRQILPCQSRSLPLWKFNPKKHRTLKRLFETTHEDAWKLLFKGNKTPPATNSDCGHDINHSPTAYVIFNVSPTCLLRG